MKLFALLFLFGCAVASSQYELRWQTGKQYAFEYSGRLLTGLPQLAPHYSGVGIKANVLVDVIAQNKFQISLENPSFARVNQRLEARLNSMDGIDGANWRELYLPQMTPVEPSVKLILEKPMVVELLHGEIREAKVAPGEPVWSVNLKKALAVLFQTKFDAASWLPEVNQISTPYSDNFWKTKEESIDGICEVTYQINELPTYMVRDKPELIPLPEQCQDQRYFELIKTKNVDNCESRASFSFYKPGKFQSAVPNSKDMSRTSETRFIACGQRGQLMLQTIVNQGEVNMHTMMKNGERFVSGNMQVLSLKEIRSVVPKPVPANMVVLENMRYSYVKQSSIPHNHPVDKSVVIPQIKQMMTTLMTEMRAPYFENMSEKQVPMQVVALAKAFSMLERSDMTVLYKWAANEFAAELHNLRTMFYDTILMTGTPEAIRFLKQQILADEMCPTQLVSLLVLMPNNVIVPQEEVLEELFELVKSPKIKQSIVTERIAIMSFTTLLQKACLSANRDTSYPSWVMGKFCTPDSAIVIKKWAPYLMQELAQTQSLERKNEIIVALGMLPRQEIVGKLIPFVEGQHPLTTRILGLWSLVSAGYSQPQIVEPIVFSLFANPGESTEMRISAFSALLKLNPPMNVFHKIAASTWTEQDKEVLKAVNTALVTLSYETTKPLEMSLAKKAQLTYPLIKKVQGVVPTSGLVYTSEVLPKLGVGYQGLTRWIASQRSFVPSSVWSELTTFMSQYQLTPLQFGFRLTGVENMYQKVAQLLAPKPQPGQSVKQQQEEIAKKLEESLNAEWRKIAQQLNIKPRQDEKMSAAVYLRAAEATPIYAGIEELTMDVLKEKINSIFSDASVLKASLAKERNFSMKRAVTLGSAMLMIPTDMGLPIEIALHAPVVVALDGKLKMEPSLVTPALRLDTKFFATVQYFGHVGTIIPFTGERVLTAIDHTDLYNLPAVLMVNADLPKQQVKIVFRGLPSVTKPIDIVHHHVHPFSAIQKIQDLTPITLAPTKMLIKSQDALKTIKKSFGESMGLLFTSQLKTESTYVDLKSILDRLALYNYNPVNILRWAPLIALDKEAKPSLRRHEYSLIFDPTQSITKEVAIDLKIGYASKSQAGVVQYHKLKIMTPAEQAQEVQSEVSLVKKYLKKLVPISFESQAISTKTWHPLRQDKLEQVLKVVEPLEAAHGVIVKASATLKAESPRLSKTYSYHAVGVGGYKAEPSLSKVLTKYQVEVSSEQTQSKIVLLGRVQAPVLPAFDIHALRASLIDYNIFNSIQYVPRGIPGWNIDILTKAKTSPEQKEYSTKSVEAKRCQELNIQLSEPCEAMRQQARALDEVEVSVTYNNVPALVKTLEARTVTVIKTLMWPFIKMDYVTPAIAMQEASPMMRTSLLLQFNRQTPSFDLTVVRPNEKIQFRQIRLPYPLELVLPLKAGMNNIKLAAQKLTGHTLYPVCRIEGQHFKTFDNSSFLFPVDHCYTLIAGDFSLQKEFGILARSLKAQPSLRELKIFLGPSEVIITPEHGAIKVIVDGIVKPLVPNQLHEIKFQSQVLGHVFMSQQNVIKLSAPKFSLIFDGQQVIVEASQLLKGQMGGLCGNLNHQFKDDMEGPQKCMYSSPEVQAAAYRINNLPMGCDAEKPLPAPIKQKLQQENQQCLQKQSIPTKISKSLKTQNGQYIILKHAVIRRPGQICISKKPIVQCAAGGQPSHAELLEKNIPFSCLKEDRVAEHYAKKAERGEKMTELDARQTTFETKVPQPRSCVSATNEL